MAAGPEATAANLLVGALAVFSLALLVLAARSWRYAKDARALLLTLGFFLYAGKSLVLLVGLFLLSDWRSLLLVSVAFDLAILLAFYLASLR